MSVWLAADIIGCNHHQRDRHASSAILEGKQTPAAS
jgi:hypothetical protein